MPSSSYQSLYDSIAEDQLQKTCMRARCTAGPISVGERLGATARPRPTATSGVRAGRCAQRTATHLAMQPGGGLVRNAGPAITVGGACRTRVAACAPAARARRWRERAPTVGFNQCPQLIAVHPRPRGHLLPRRCCQRRMSAAMEEGRRSPRSVREAVTLRVRYT